MEVHIELRKYDRKDGCKEWCLKERSEGSKKGRIEVRKEVLKYRAKYAWKFIRKYGSMEIWKLVWKENLQGSSKEKMKGRRKFVNTEGII